MKVVLKNQQPYVVLVVNVVITAQQSVKKANGKYIEDSVGYLDDQVFLITLFILTDQ